MAFRNFAVRCSIDGDNNGETLDNYQDTSLARLGDTTVMTNELGQSLFVVFINSACPFGYYIVYRNVKMH